MSRIRWRYRCHCTRIVHILRAWLRYFNENTTVGRRFAGGFEQRGQFQLPFIFAA
jgi:hypothetical protein